MKQKKKALLGLAVLLCAAALLAGIYLTFRPQTQQGAKTVTVEVIAAGETVQTHTIHTDAEYLRGALEQEEMVAGEESSYGLFIKTVDGMVEYQIKPGTATDTKVRLRGKGVPMLNNKNVRGDHYVTLVVHVPENLNREQKKALTAYAKACGENPEEP